MQYEFEELNEKVSPRFHFDPECVCDLVSFPLSGKGLSCQVDIHACESIQCMEEQCVCCFTVCSLVIWRKKYQTDI